LTDLILAALIFLSLNLDIIIFLVSSRYYSCSFFAAFPFSTISLRSFDSYLPPFILLYISFSILFSNGSISLSFFPIIDSILVIITYACISLLYGIIFTISSLSGDKFIDSLLLSLLGEPPERVVSAPLRRAPPPPPPFLYSVLRLEGEEIFP